MITRLKENLFKPVNIHSLIFIRIAFGLIMLREIIKFFQNDWIDFFFLDREFNFKYYGFEWVQTASPFILNSLFIILGICAILVAIGLFYRAAIIIFTLGFSYVFLLEKAIYLNHYYLIILFGFLLCFMPANRYFSIDANFINKKIKSSTIYSWPIILIKIQLEIILIYAGIVKLNSDWLQLYPLRFWFDGHGPFFSNIYVIGLASYYAILVHIIGAPLLFLKKFRIYIFVLYAIFHSINAYIFTVDIGIFPWITLALTTIFFEPNWPLQILKFIQEVKKLTFINFVNIKKCYQNSAKLISKINQKTLPKISTKKENLILILIIIWTIFHLIFPLRKYLYPGNTAWHGQGYYFAWQMKLHNMVGNLSFHIKDNKSGKYLNDYEAEQYYSLPGQMHFLTYKQAIGMGCKPYMILQYAHFLKEKYKTKIGHDDISVYAINFCSLNGRKPQMMIDQNVDLANEIEDFSHPKWILPLDEKLKPGQGGFDKFRLINK